MKKRIKERTEKFKVISFNKIYKCKRFIFGRQGNLRQTISVEGIMGQKYDGDGNYSSDNDCMKAAAKMLAFELISGTN